MGEQEGQPDPRGHKKKHEHVLGAEHEGEVGGTTRLHQPTREVRVQLGPEEGDLHVWP